ncbi:MAG: glycerol kinase GlpK [Candidatus Omnitrophica bacterium]|nr:glycerol kinase GlpK [Candidatus Omnitrophota bacterium]MDD5487761.1 glycerol kinase GlpK [Candidatus Omnitrophota bacterium]
MKYILAIDQGTTGSRAIIYDRKGRVVASSYREFKQYFPKPGWVEHDPREIWASVDGSIQDVLLKVPPGSITAIGITNQRETTVLWDAQTSKPVHRAIVWQCRRTAERCDHIRKSIGAAFFRERTGLPVDAYFSATKIEWILRNVKGAREKARLGKIRFGTTDTWVLWNLTGGKVHATDFTNASRTMLFNINKKAWDGGILKKLNIPRSILPEVRTSSGVFGYTVKRGRLPAGIPVSGIAGDQQAALFGQACFSPGSVKNTYGTGSFILMNVGKKKVRSEHGLILTLGCGRRGEPVYVLEGAVFVAGAAIQWLRDGLRIIRNARETEKMAAGLKDNYGVYFVPALVGLGAPYWDQDARGAIYGITRGTTGAHIARAAIEAICYQTRDVLDAMRKDSGIKIKELKVDGGAAANSFLCQFQADITGTKVVRPRIIETTSAGAAYLAGLAVGYWKNADEIRKFWREDRVFTPAMGKAKAGTLYKEWKGAVGRTLTK